MNREIFNHGSIRAHDARFHMFFRPMFRVFAWAVFYILLVSGLLLVFGAKLSVGWFVASFAVYPLMLLIWDKRQLQRLEPHAGNSIDARLEGDLLGLLPSNPTLMQLIDQLGRVRSGQFMMARLGLSPQFMQLDGGQDAVTALWQNVTAQYPEGLIYASDLFQPLLAMNPMASQLLPHLQLDIDDVGRGAAWYRHIKDIVSLDGQHHPNGGIARDWSFGYTPLLNQYASNLSDEVAGGGLMAVDIEAHSGAIDYMNQVFSGGGSQNVALIGPVGAGKTTVVKAFAEQLLKGDNRISSSLQFRQVFSLSASSLISAAPGRGQIEGLLNSVLYEAYKAKNIILCLDDAQLFFEENVGSVDVSNVLMPVLQGGGMRLILTMDQQRFLEISARNPALAALLNKYVVNPATEEETVRVMQDQALRFEYHQGVLYMYQALKEAYRLSERYLYDVAQPGKSLQLLQGAANYSENKIVTMSSMQKTIEQTQGVKVGATAGEDERQKLLGLEDLIHQRMINQTRAVTVVSDALRRARAGVRNEKRPIGTFLFLGPTGVGKTELSKALAEVYFGGEDHMIRLDMNEYVGPTDVTRLIADGVDDPRSLSAQVMKQPFSVVLLDELEKAHDAVLTTLLQALDEGVMRDIKGREVSFRDAIIIATSNAGADQIRHHIEMGENLEDIEQLLTDELISSHQFRPEFLNRFDEIVLFRPLNEPELMQVVTLIIDGINKTLEPQKISVAVDDELKLWLVRNGNDPRLGARPMRRIVQRVVENTMAKRMLSGAVQPGEVVQLSLQDLGPEEQAAAASMRPQQLYEAPQAYAEPPAAPPPIPPRSIQELSQAADMGETTLPSVNGR